MNFFFNCKPFTLTMLTVVGGAAVFTAGMVLIFTAGSAWLWWLGLLMAAIPAAIVALGAVLIGLYALIGAGPQ